MKFEWNWGMGLFISASIFMLMLIVFAWFMFRENYDLVEKDYYPKALEYQQKIDKTMNAKQLVEKVTIENQGGSIHFVFPSFFIPDSIHGNIYFYRPSEKKGDLSVPIQLDSSGRMSFVSDRLFKGKYLIKIDYNYQKKGYYQEEPVFIEK
jgi:hypothetical protein